MKGRVATFGILRAAIAACALAAFLAGCSRVGGREAPSKECACEEGGARLVDQALMAWLSKARTFHHLADLAESDGATDRAIAALDQLVGGAMPPGSPPEVNEVLADTFARLAELRVRRGEFERADADVTAGLARATEKTYFRGHLLEVRGLVYEKLSQSLEKADKKAEARTAREKAIAASMEAVRLQDEVIASTLGDAGAPRKKN